MSEFVTPTASRPYIPEYGIPEDVKGVLSWDYVEERMTAARNYWVATVSPAGHPHAMPVWGVWIESTLYFGGGAHTRWSRNLAANSNVAVHLESGDAVLALEGYVDRITDPAHPLVAKIDAAYNAKYHMPHGIPFWVLRPRVAFAWTQFPADTTRWRFAAP